MRLNTASLNDVVAAPLDDDSWYGICVPCRMRASRWFVATMRGVDTTRPYETVGYVVSGRALLHLEGQVVRLDPGDSWVVPKNSVHRYEVIERFVAVEATHPPAQAHARDEH